ncbi:MAG TPA: hypothetical protein VHH73_16915, partial [Verrucomicrobiae bacterium]|nr:hypothetical protein [Verrucomicrobiae bacterium]
MFPTPLLLVVLAQTAPTPASVNPAPVPADAAPAGPVTPPNTAQAPGFGWLPLFHGENLDG